MLENLGAVYSGSSNWEGAVNAFKKAVSIAPAKPTYRASLAKMLFRTGTCWRRVGVVGRVSVLCMRIRVRMRARAKRAIAVKTIERFFLTVFALISDFDTGALEKGAYQYARAIALAPNDPAIRCVHYKRQQNKSVPVHRADW